MSATDSDQPQAATAPASTDPVRVMKLYRAAWRWHFYAGIAVIPFFLILAVTGLLMLWTSQLQGRDGDRIGVEPMAAAMPLSHQAQAAAAALPGGSVRQYIAPRAPDQAAIFRVDLDSSQTMVAVDPYRAEVLAQTPRGSGLYYWAESLHGTLMAGVTGDRVLEIAASLGMVVLATGLYLWWPRQGGAMRALLPRLAASGRGLWKSLHASVGIWVSLVLILFLISGLTWTGIWGQRLVQAWSSFPAGKYGDIPVSDVTHDSLNGGTTEVPWALTQTPMPASDEHAGHDGAAPAQTAAGAAGVAGPVDFDSVDALARRIGFDGRYQLNLPRGETGVWTISRDSTSNDSPDPTSDRVVHVDRYSGNILADIRYEDYSVMGKAMAVGIALHMGTLSLWSVLANTLVCLAVIFLCVSGVAMWWLRRPSGSLRLAAPPMPADMPLWKGAMAVGLALSLAFPMAGLTLATVLMLDLLILSRVPALKRAFG